MKIRVIEIVRDGEVLGFLKGEHCLDNDAIVSNPLDAINFLTPPSYPSWQRNPPAYNPDGATQKALDGLHLAGDEIWPRSGIYADEANVVEFEITVVETNRRQGREPYRSKNANV